MIAKTSPMEFKRIAKNIAYRLGVFFRPVVCMKYGLHTMGIVLLTIGLYQWGRYNLAGMPNLTPTTATFSITDFYNAVANHRPITERDSVIVIVSVDSCSRQQIAQALSDIDFCRPAAMGLDVFFGHPTGNDSELVEAILNCENLILPVMLDYDFEHGYVTGCYGSFFQDTVKGKPVGAVNLAGSSSLSVIRQFTPNFTTNKKDTIRSFAAALAAKGRPESYKRLTARGNNLEYINYPSRQFDIIPAAEVLQNAEELENKIVIVGNVEDITDVHLTPIDIQMSGTLVHAYILSTILSGHYIEKSSNFSRWIWAIIAAIILVWFRVLYTFKANAYSKLIIRILQFLLIWLCAYFGYKTFINKGIYWDFSLALMIGLSMLVADIWFAVGALARKFIGLWIKK